jgi:hypothetical protein
MNQDLLPRGHYYRSAAGRLALRDALHEAGLSCLTGGDVDPLAALGVGRASIDHLCIAGMTPAPREDGSLSAIVGPMPENLGRHLSDDHGVAVGLVDT